MRLSEAIRLGATLGPQIKHAMYRSADDASCAFGAAQIAVGVRDRISHIAKLWPWLNGTMASCPTCGVQTDFACVVHMNDCCNFTREQIADFVATIEPKEGPCSSVESVTSPAVQEKKLVESR